MKVTIEEWSTRVKLTPEDVETECRPDNGADTCVYLKTTIRSDGMAHHSCQFNQWQFNFNLSDRLPDMTAQRMGCDRVISWHKLGLITRENTGHTFDIPE